MIARNNEEPRFSPNVFPLSGPAPIWARCCSHLGAAGTVGGPGWPDWLKVPAQASPVEAGYSTGSRCWAAFVLQHVAQGSPGFTPWLQPSWGAIAHLECLQRQRPRAGRESLGLSAPAFL